MAGDLGTPGDAAGGEHAGLLRAVQGQDPRAARAFVEDVLNIAGISTVAGAARRRSPSGSCRAPRPTRRAASARSRGGASRFAAVAGDPDAASAQMRTLAAEARLDLSRVLDAFDARTGFIAARGVDVTTIAFSAAFGRNLDHYTGVVFEIRDGRRSGRQPC